MQPYLWSTAQACQHAGNFCQTHLSTTFDPQSNTGNGTGNKTQELNATYVFMAAGNVAIGLSRLARKFEIVSAGSGPVPVPGLGLELSCRVSDVDVDMYIHSCSIATSASPTTYCQPIRSTPHPSLALLPLAPVGAMGCCWCPNWFCGACCCWP